MTRAVNDFATETMERHRNKFKGLSAIQFSMLLQHPEVKHVEPDETADEALSAEVCAICLMGLTTKPSIQLPRPCKHWYHSDCAEQWLKRKATCPLCSCLVRRFIN